MLHSRSKMALIAVALVALVALVAGGLIAFFVPSSHESGSSNGSSHTIFIALLPLYTSFIAIFAARRRRNKKTDG